MTSRVKSFTYMPEDMGFVTWPTNLKGPRNTTSYPVPGQPQFSVKVPLMTGMEMFLLEIYLEMSMCTFITNGK